MDLGEKAIKVTRNIVGAAFPRFRGHPYYCDPVRGLNGKTVPANRLAALQGLLVDAEDRTVLDLGCAEGLIAEEFLKAGAREVAGFDIRRSRIVEARRLMPVGNARFEVADLSDWGQFEQTHKLLPGYDIVLFLGLYQHLPRDKRIEALYGAARRCLHRLALRMPHELFCEVDEVLGGLGFLLRVEIESNGLHVSRFRLYEREAPTTNLAR